MKIQELTIHPVPKTGALKITKAFRTVEMGVIMMAEDGRLYHSKKGIFHYGQSWFSMADLMRIAKATGLFTEAEVRKHAARASDLAKQQQRREAADRMKRMAKQAGIALTAEQSRAIRAL